MITVKITSDKMQQHDCHCFPAFKFLTLVHLKSFILTFCDVTYFKTCTVYLFVNFYYRQQMHNYLIKVHITTVSLCNIYTFTCFDTIVSSSGSLRPMPCYVTHIGYKLLDVDAIVSKYLEV
jgi:hypothetical protein